MKSHLGSGDDNCCSGWGGEGGNASSPFFDASGNKIIGATIRNGNKIRCLPYAGFFCEISCSVKNDVLSERKKCVNTFCVKKFFYETTFWSK